MQFIKIDKDFQNLLRPLTAEEFKSLEDSIKQDGCLRPVELWNGYIVDGHNRYSICMKNDIPFEQVDVTEKFETKSDVMKWIVQNQRARQTGRQLSKSELVQMAQAVEKQVAVEAEAKMLAGKKDPTTNFGEGDDRHKRESVTKAAESIGVSSQTYRDMKLVTEKGSDEQIERMNKGGRGNAPSAIAKEIKGTKVSEVCKCKECGKVLPISHFDWVGGKPRHVCRKCRVQRDAISRNERRLQGTDGFYVESVEEKIWSPDEIVDQLKRDFDSYIEGLKLELDVHRDEIKSHESVIDETLNVFIQTLETMKGAYK